MGRGQRTWADEGVTDRRRTDEDVGDWLVRTGRPGFRVVVSGDKTTFVPVTPSSERTDGANNETHASARTSRKKERAFDASIQLDGMSQEEFDDLCERGPEALEDVVQDKIGHTGAAVFYVERAGLRGVSFSADIDVGDVTDEEVVAVIQTAIGHTGAQVESVDTRR